MAATLIFELLCVASLVFMIRFLIALSREGKTKSRCHVVHVMSHYPESEEAAFMSSNANSRQRFKLIVEGRGRPSL